MAQSYIYYCFLNFVLKYVLLIFNTLQLKPYVSLTSPKVDSRELTGLDLLEMVEDSTEVTETSSHSQT